MRDPSWACAQIIHRFFRCLDENRVEDAVALFAADGVWVRRSDNIAGHASILKALTERPSGRVTRHIISNVIADEEGGSMLARYDFMIFSHEGSFVGVPPLAPPHTLLSCEDRLVDSLLGWRFSSRSSRVIFASQ
jgi:hypothetical protein